MPLVAYGLIRSATAANRFEALLGGLVVRVGAGDGGADHRSLQPRRRGRRCPHSCGA